MPTPPRVSVILPVFNEARDIGSLIRQVTDQTPPPGGVEILVVDGGSGDGTQDIVTTLQEEVPGLRLLHNPKRRSSAARNVGAEAARGEFVLYLDGHCSVPRRDYLVRLVEIFESTEADCLCRPQPLVHLSEGEWGWAIATARHSRLGHNAGSDIYGGEPKFTDPRSSGAAYRRQVLDRLGGYDDRFDACEDVEFNHRVLEAGLRSFLHPDLAIHYRPRRTPGGLLRQMIRYGRGRARLMARHPATAPIPLLLVSALLLAIPLTGLGVGWSSAVFLLTGILILWTAAVLFESVRLGRTPVRAARIAASFFMIYLGLVAGFWRGCLEFTAFRRPGPVPAWAPGEDHSRA